MSDSPSLLQQAEAIVDVVLSGSAAPLQVGGVDFIVVSQSGDASRAYALNVIISIVNMGNSNVAKEELEAYDGGPITVNIMDRTGADSFFALGLVNINVHMAGNAFYKVLNGFAPFNIQQIVNHEVMHAITDLDDGVLHNSLVNQVNSQTDGGPPRTECDGGSYFNSDCFLSGTPILLPSGETRLIERIAVDDVVQSYDPCTDALAPGRVVRVMRPTSTHILDLHGTMITPGHVTLCGTVEGEANPFTGRHVPVLDILRTDGALVKADGGLVRASTGCPVGSSEDCMIRIVVDGPDGAVEGEIRLGATHVLHNGRESARRRHVNPAKNAEIAPGNTRSAASSRKWPLCTRGERRAVIPSYSILYTLARPAFA